MLNFRNTSWCFFCLVLLAIGFNFFYEVPVYIYMILPVVYLLLVGYGCYYIQASFFIPVICSLKTNKKVIALSFDDGPDPEKTPQILRLLKETNTKATFFCIGNKIAANKDIVKQTYNEGHLIGNHSFSHGFWFDMLSTEKMTDELRATDEAVNDAIGKKPKLFRPPYGVTNPNVRNAILSGDYIPVGWNVRSLDTVIKDQKKLLAKIKNKLAPGAVFLFHDTSNTTLAILPEFIGYVKSKGYHVERLDKMLNLQAYA
jgi:peptidoglycan/xylan/chitin deacetylase (PgdA/CDA1 family)